MRKQLEALWRQEISFDTFAAETADDWTRLASTIWHGWRAKLPPTVSLDDVRQELLLHAWLAVAAFDPERGSLQKFVIFSACAKATRFIHAQRGALRRADSAESRHPVALSTLRDTDEWVDAVLNSPQQADELLDLLLRFERGLRAAEGLELYALKAVAMASGDVELASTFLYDALPVRWRLKNQWSENTASRCVENALRAVYTQQEDHDDDFAEL